MFQVKMGKRHIVIPGQRRQTTVVIMFTAPRIVPRPAMTRPMIQRSGPAPGCWCRRTAACRRSTRSWLLRWGWQKPAVAMTSPNKFSQYDRAFRRGKATSGAPICNGRTKLAKPKTIGVA